MLRSMSEISVVPAGNAMPPSASRQSSICSRPLRTLSSCREPSFITAVYTPTLIVRMRRGPALVGPECATGLH
ncbi:Uncharacterised protein [Mycobacterium tuberculosis]|uniref:Uncharacterized protein n=1 Tax=Mycobacterium tuberculosis TaxID=1773 RepID=A0A0U0QN57_MYCTX|nr:Uncharacterised protein [Mycobacterium tuberculosis]COX10913.1 Uncharacterised protein [Mycobacterium tuberculosis]COY90797.1 Uncharacterised protein [Mycobacterium tuberculosis]